MQDLKNRRLLFFLLAIALFVICVILLRSCKSSESKTETTSDTNKLIVNPYETMTPEEIFHMKDSVYQILSRCDDGFYYMNASDSLFFFDYDARREVLVFTNTPLSGKSIENISLNTLTLNISSTGDVNVVRSQVSTGRYELYEELIRRTRAASNVDTNRFFGKAGFIIEVEGSRGFNGYEPTKYYLIKPLGEGRVEALLLPTEGEDESTGIEYCTEIVFLRPILIHVTCRFNLNHVPEPLRPEFTNSDMNYALIKNPSFGFNYGVMIEPDGTVLQNDKIDFAHLDYEMDKKLFKSKAALKNYLKSYGPQIMKVVNKDWEDVEIDSHNSLQLIYNMSKKENSWNEVAGKSFYLDVIIDDISARNQSDGMYCVKFANKQPDGILSTEIYALSSDYALEKLKLPAKVSVRATVNPDFKRPGYQYGSFNLINEMNIVR